jgi:hypothetical protein
MKSALYSSDFQHTTAREPERERIVFVHMCHWSMTAEKRAQRILYGKDIIVVEKLPTRGNDHDGIQIESSS